MNVSWTYNNDLTVNINRLFAIWWAWWTPKQTAAVAVIYMSERMRGNQAVKTGGDAGLADHSNDVTSDAQIY